MLQVRKNLRQKNYFLWRVVCSLELAGIAVLPIAIAFVSLLDEHRYCILSLETRTNTHNSTVSFSDFPHRHANSFYRIHGYAATPPKG